MSLSLRLKIRFLLLLCLFFGVIFFVWMRLVPTGNIIYTNDFKKKNDFLTSFSPEERVLRVDSKEIITGDPVYFTLRTPRNFEEATLRMKFKRPGNEDNVFPIIEAGILRDNKIWRYDLNPMQNLILDKMTDTWKSIKDGEFIFLQRKSDFDSLDSFITSFEELDKLAVYNYEFDKEFIDSDYKNSEEIKTINYVLRGDYQFFAYIKDEVLKFEFLTQDLNQNRTSDQVDIHVYYRDALIYSSNYPDDGIEIDNSVLSQEKIIDLDIPDLPEGVYKVEFRANNDILTKKIETKQSKLAFVNKIWLSEGDYPESLMIDTDIKELRVKAVHPSGLQSIDFSNSKVEIGETYKQFSVLADDSSTTTEINLSRGGVALEGRGVFCFNNFDCFNPQTKVVDKNFIADGVDYILANYKPPIKEGDYFISENKFNLSGAYSENNKYSFIISLPGLSDIESKELKGLEVVEFSVELKGKNLFDKLKEIYKKYVKK